ncbi:unnamed protein product [Owenia fusiformis]|uniref:Carboxylic ester hydrolase n=1 Tax=Owenia fusiformis TaxID=6347 RepID=A0A8S4PKY9_OWEFU|nr:unnamed protein product [Owenia fusiformis]
MYSRILYAILLTGVVAEAVSGPTVFHTIKDGGLRGFLQYSTGQQGKPIFTFRNIPYAAPPLGDLRFKPPQKNKPWSGVRDATEKAKECPQDPAMSDTLEEAGWPIEKNRPMSEDCLRLDVFTPTLNEKAKLPVMVWIHGGGFIMGSNRVYDGTVLAATGDVVIVPINYRLATLAWLNTGDEDAPGNLGFLDQIQALKWVKENIASFGGDPGEITIFGESAGGVSVVALSLSPLGEGLFSRAIAQSGSAITNSFLIPAGSSGSMIRELSKAVGCNETEDNREIIMCLRSKTWEELTEAKPPEGMPYWPFLPICGDAFMPKPPKDMVKESDVKARIKSLDIMTGVTENEGYMMAGKVLAPHFTVNKTRETMFQDLKAMLQIFGILDPSDEEASQRVEKTLNEKYLPQENPTEDELTLVMSRLTGDFMLIAPTLQTAHLFKEIGANVFVYELSHSPLQMRNHGRPEYIKADHGDDIMYMFGFPKSPLGPEEGIVWDDDDLILENQMLKYWTNFGKTGNPNGGDLLEWPQFSTDNHEAISLRTHSVILTQFSDDSVKFWSETVPNILKKQDSDQKEEL